MSIGFLPSMDRVVSSICGKVEQCILDETFVKEFNMSGLPSLSEKLEKFLTLLVGFPTHSTFSFSVYFSSFS